MIHKYIEGNEKLPGLSIGWVKGPVMCLFIATYRNRYSFYVRFNTVTKKLFKDYRKWTLADDCKTYSFQRGPGSTETI